MKLRSSIKAKLIELRKGIVDHCDLCMGVGYLEPEIPGEELPCECMKLYLYVMELVIAGIPQRYWLLDLWELNVDDAYIQFVDTYIENIIRAKTNGLGMIYFGANGTGKTSIMCEIGKHAIINGYKTSYFTSQQYVDTKSGSKKDPETLLVLDEYENAEVILLDELDKVYIKSGSAFVVKTMEDFMRRSLSSNKILIACTNYDEEQFAKVFGDSVISMLKRHNQFIAVEGDDFSDNVQDAWSELLENGFDYYHTNIVSMAEAFRVKQREVDSEQWKQQLT